MVGFFVLFLFLKEMLMCNLETQHPTDSNPLPFQDIGHSANERLKENKTKPFFWGRTWKMGCV